MKTVDLLDIFDKFHHESIGFFESLIQFSSDNLEDLEKLFDEHEDYLRALMMKVSSDFSRARLKNLKDEEVPTEGYNILLESLQAIPTTQEKGLIVLERIAKFKLKLGLHGKEPNG